MMNKQFMRICENRLNIFLETVLSYNLPTNIPIIIALIINIFFGESEWFFFRNQFRVVGTKRKTDSGQWTRCNSNS